MRITVTGGAGFIGANLCRHLVGRGHQVRVLDDLSTGTVDNLVGVAVETTIGTLLDRDAVDAVCNGSDAVVHLAALGSVPRSVAEPMASFDANVVGTMHVLEAARRGDIPVVFASSSSVYGANPLIPKVETMVPRPMSPYAAGKLAAESAVLAYHASYGLPVLAFRFFNVFGPLQRAGHAYAAVVPAFVDAALRARPVTIYGDGLQSRDFTFVDTVCAVLTDAAERAVTSDEPVNLAFGTNISLLDVLDELSRQLGTRPEIEFRAVRPGDVRHSSADNTRLRGLFPDVVPVPFAEGLAATVNWMRGVVDGPTSRS